MEGSPAQIDTSRRYRLLSSALADLIDTSTDEEVRLPVLAVVMADETVGWLQDHFSVERSGERGSLDPAAPGSARYCPSGRPADDPDFVMRAVSIYRQSRIADWRMKRAPVE